MSYKSKGTVRLEDIKSKKLIFVPDSDHSVKYGDDERAVFFDSTVTGGGKFDRGKIVDLDKDFRGVQVTVASSIWSDPLAIPLLVSVAVEQQKVEIEVEISSSVELINIAQPAP